MFSSGTTCYENHERPSCIDLFLSNCENHFLMIEILETGLSDSHKLVITATMLKFEKQPPQIVTYRNYKNYNKELFEKDIQIKLSEFDIENIPYETFINIFINILNLHAPLKKKYLRANHSKFISKELSKEIMLRSKLRNKFLKDETDEARAKYRKQRNICVHLLRRAKRNYYNDLDLSNVTDNRKFWKTTRPLFANKIKVKNKITLHENSKSTKDDQQLANIFNSFFVNTASCLKISFNKSLPQNRDISKLVEHAIKNFENHSSIIAIKNNRNPNDQFSLKPVTKEMIAKEISDLKSGKAVRSNDIPTKIIKEFKRLICYIYIQQL